MELKNKALPVYGTRQEKLDRLKKANGKENMKKQKGVEIPGY